MVLEQQVDPERELLLGKRELARGRLPQASERFRHAVEICPIESRLLLSECLYWLGLSMLRMSKLDIAARCLASSQKLIRRGYARHLYLHVTNGYGMPKRSKPEDDDSVAFFSIKIAQYLKQCSKTAFSSRNERDIVLSSLNLAWKRLIAAPGWTHKSCPEKQEAFERIRPSFPVDLSLPVQGAEILTVNFQAKKRLHPGDSCNCGSGLPFGRCCGRTHSLHESPNGYY
jgi:hypothetical protein